jgi:hypothetical protein
MSWERVKAVTAMNTAVGTSNRRIAAKSIAVSTRTFRLGGKWRGKMYASAMRTKKTSGRAILSIVQEGFQIRSEKAKAIPAAKAIPRM